MKKIKTLTLALLTVILVGTTLYAAVDIVDNRDYPEDTFDIYVFQIHVGHYCGEHNQIEWQLTGK